MKSYGSLWQEIVSEENLNAAVRRVIRGRRSNPAVMEFMADLAGELRRLQQELVTGCWQPGAYVQFRVTDPKPRTISCALVRDRVVHHALCAVIAPLLERSFTDDCYACRVGKGTHRAASRAQYLVRRHGWFCKLDIRHYFNSVEHERLLALLWPLFREQQVRDLIERVVAHPVPGLPAGYGLPIGNLTSQWFANFYLSGLDHYVKEQLRAPAYVRYMDDMLVFAGSKAETWRIHDGICRWVVAERGLAIKDEKTVVAPVSEGAGFLGLRIHRSGWRLQRSRFLRTRSKFRYREQQCQSGAISEERLVRCAVAFEGGLSWYGFKGVLRMQV